MPQNSRSCFLISNQMLKSSLTLITKTSNRAPLFVSFNHRKFSSKVQDSFAHSGLSKVQEMVRFSQLKFMDSDFIDTSIHSKEVYVLVFFLQIDIDRPQPDNIRFTHISYRHLSTFVSCYENKSQRLSTLHKQ